jgi:hypothetical protein
MQAMLDEAAEAVEREREKQVIRELRANMIMVVVVAYVLIPLAISMVVASCVHQVWWQALS